MLDRQQVLIFLKENKEYFFNRYHLEIKALFGSYARDEATEDSDIDIIYESNNDISLQSYLEAEAYLCTKLNKPIELVNYKYMNPIIKMTAEKDMIYV